MISIGNTRNTAYCGSYTKSPGSI